MRARSALRRAFTLVEIIVAMAVLCILVGCVFALTHLFFSGGPRGESGVSGQITASFVRQDIRMALQKLVDRLQEGVELTVPGPGETGRILEFQDVLNNSIRVARDAASGSLLSWRLARGGTRPPEPEDVTYLPLAGREPYAVTRPVLIRDVESVVFTAVSHDLVVIDLTIREGSRRASLLTQVRLRNQEMVR